jgi:hypothetical protein
MSTQYFCDNKRRAQIIRADPAILLNGIDYLEVLDSESPEEALRQRTLLVRLLRAVPALTADNARIEDGVRVAPVGVEWVGSAAAAATLLADGLITPAEAAFFSAQPQPDRLLLVRTDSDGDFSTYTFRLVESSTSNEPPTGFDPILSEVAFSFKVECPDEFDCEPDDDCLPEPESSPDIDYLAKDYSSFHQLLLDRLAVTNPNWQEAHAPDLNLALVELLAYVGDYLSYWQDGVATEAYLETARRRTSVRRHARLLAYAMHEGCNARTWVQFEVDPGPDVTLPGRESVSDTPIRLLTRMPAEPVELDEADLDRLLAQNKPAVFELRTPVTLREAHNRIRFHTWGDEECCLPAGATRASLLNSDNASEQLDLTPGDVLLFEELISSETGSENDANLAHRHAVRLVTVEETRDLLFDVPVLEITWADEDALPFPLCLSTRHEDILLEEVSVARGNVALADHGRTVEREPLPEKFGHRKYRPRLSRIGITVAEPSIDTTQPATRILSQDPRQALAAIELQGDGQIWSTQRDLLDSDRFAPHFVAEIESDGRVQLRFGDDLYGLHPSDDAFNAEPDGAIYRIGTGTAGNIGAETLSHIIAPISGIAVVRNPLPAVDGTDPESLDEVRQYAPQAFRRQERAVTAEDYAAVSERHPAVQRAVATRRWTGSWHTMFISVDRKSGLPVDAEFEAEIRLHIERYRLAGHDVEIDPPRFVSLDIRMTVCVKPDYFRSEVKAELLAVFSNRVLPDGRLGFCHADNSTFGKPVYLSEVIAAVMSVTGVQWVDILPKDDKDHRFRRWGKKPNQEIKLGKIDMARLEIVRLDNDSSLPENGKIEFYMEGGL